MIDHSFENGLIHPSTIPSYLTVKKNLRVGVFNMRKSLLLPYTYTFNKKCDSEAMKDPQTKSFGKKLLN